ncbi:MAG TPA: M14 family metallopeptidase [Nitrososphaeraceae archaeon]|jgi:murein tripeptide amidase MpaA
MDTKFFVSIIAPTKLDLINLNKYEIDVFQSTAQINEQKKFSIDGLLTLEEVGRLVKDGYKVTVKDESSKHARARSEAVGFKQWMTGTEREMAEVSEESMSGGGYLTSQGIESALLYMNNKFPLITEIISLPERTHEGRSSRAVRILKGSQGDKNGILLIGGVHAREIVNPDLLLTFALRLCQAYSSGTSLIFGGKTYSADIIKSIVEHLDIIIFPLVNPDGRAFVQSPTGDPMWRKNRNLNPSLQCKGVDINRNYDFLWSSGIGTSANSCSEVFKGVGAFSEPETRNVRYLIDTYSNVSCMIDVHSYSEDILYPWGDDDDQTTNTFMNFTNHSYDGQRGTLGDTLYGEYIPKSDSDWYKETGAKMSDSIASVRGTRYTVMEANDLYPTTGTSHDYAYSRHFVNTNERSILGYTLETGKTFQPPYSEAVRIIKEVSAGLIEFCLASIVIVEKMN